MEKIQFALEGGSGTEEFFVLEQTTIGGSTYILVTDSEEDDAICLILKDISNEQDSDGIYEVVEDDVELLAVSKVFEELLEDVDIEM